MCLTGVNYLFPSDLLPFTRRPLLIVIDSDNSSAFEVSLCLFPAAPYVQCSGVFRDLSGFFFDSHFPCPRLRRVCFL